MNRRKSIIYTSIFVLLLAVMLSSTATLKGCFSKTLSRTFFAADTVCTITLYDGNEDALDGAVELVTTLANRLNCKDEASELNKLNTESSAVSPSSELLDVIQKGVYFSNISNGVFDITVKPLSDLWDFKNAKIPSNAEILSATKKIDFKNIKIQNGSVSLENGAKIDLGGIAKGYIADKISDFLLKNGVKSAIINLGGNVTVIGKNKGEKFNIGIQKPFEDGTAALISCSDTSVVTSGIYQRYFEENGKIYHHLLNTKTGYPEQNSLYSVTIISPSATAADALSTLCFLKGLKEGLAFIEQTPNTEAVFIDQNQKLHLSTGLKMNNNLIEIK